MICIASCSSPCPPPLSSIVQLYLKREKDLHLSQFRAAGWGVIFTLYQCVIDDKIPTHCYYIEGLERGGLGWDRLADVNEAAAAKCGELADVGGALAKFAQRVSGIYFVFGSLPACWGVTPAWGGSGSFPVSGQPLAPYQTQEKQAEAQAVLSMIPDLEARLDDMSKVWMIRLRCAWLRGN